MKPPENVKSITKSGDDYKAILAVAIPMIFCLMYLTTVFLGSIKDGNDLVLSLLTSFHMFFNGRAWVEFFEGLITILIGTFLAIVNSLNIFKSSQALVAVITLSGIYGLVCDKENTKSLLISILAPVVELIKIFLEKFSNPALVIVYFVGFVLLFHSFDKLKA